MGDHSSLNNMLSASKEMKAFSKDELSKMIKLFKASNASNSDVQEFSNQEVETIMELP